MANTDVTLDDARKSLLSARRAASGFTHKWTIKYTDIDEGSGSSDTVTVALGNTYADFVITKAMINADHGIRRNGRVDGPSRHGRRPEQLHHGNHRADCGTDHIGCRSGPVTLAGTYAVAADALEALFTNSSSGSPSAPLRGKWTSTSGCSTLTTRLTSLVFLGDS